MTPVETALVGDDLTGAGARPPRPSPCGPPTVADLIAPTRGQVVGYKVPKEIHLVDVIARNPAGKPDTVWARTTALRLSQAAAAQAPEEVNA